MRFKRRFALALLLGCFGMSAPMQAGEFSEAQRTEIKTVIRDYLVKNPEVLQEAMVELDRRQKAEEAATREKIVGQKAEDLFNSTNGSVIGNPEGKVTLVEFFDYNCGYCKKSLDDVAQLIKSEPELRVVLKDFPVLGPGSIEAAQVAGAARLQLKGDAFWRFHSRLLATHGPVGRAQAMAAAQESGADMTKLGKDIGEASIKSNIQDTMQLADALSLTGTPSFVVGQEVIVGAVGYDALKGKIDNVLKCGKAICS